MSAIVVDPLVLQKITAWIGVRGIVPAPLTDVLVAVPKIAVGGSIVDMGYRRSDGRWVLSNSDPQLFVEVTHWMPLPMPQDRKVENGGQKIGNDGAGMAATVVETDEVRSNDEERVDRRAVRRDGAAESGGRHGAGPSG